MATVDREIYRPILLTIEDAIRSELPLLDGRAVSAIAEKVLDNVGETRVLNEPYATCERRFCRNWAVWGTMRCPDHTKDDDA